MHLDKQTLTIFRQWRHFILFRQVVFMTRWRLIYSSVMFTVEFYRSWVTSISSHIMLMINNNEEWTKWGTDWPTDCSCNFSESVYYLAAHFMFWVFSPSVLTTHSRFRCTLVWFSLLHFKKSSWQGNCLALFFMLIDFMLIIKIVVHLKKLQIRIQCIL